MIAPSTAPSSVEELVKNALKGSRPKKRFTPMAWKDIEHAARDEWLVKRIIPTRGVGILYGQSMTFKSFVALHIGFCVATGQAWAGRRTRKADILYICAEGAGGFKKRKAGIVKTWPQYADIGFHMIPAAPNLGAAKSDLEELIAQTEDVGVQPGMIVIDTASKVIAGAEENGVGMGALLANAEALANHFKCFVLIIHHVGHGDDAQKRPRGSSATIPAMDVAILAERVEGEMSTTLTVQKAKDEESGIALTATLSRVVLNHDEDGDEESTFVVTDVKEAERPVTKGKGRVAGGALSIFKQAFYEALDSKGAETTPRTDLPMARVKAVDKEHVRNEFYKIHPGEAAAKRQAFARDIEKAVKEGFISSITRGKETIFWLAAHSS